MGGGSGRGPTWVERVVGDRWRRRGRWDVGVLIGEVKGGAALTEPAREDSGSPSGSGSIPAPSLKPKKGEGRSKRVFSSASSKFRKSFPLFLYIFLHGIGDRAGPFFFHHRIGSTARTLAAQPQKLI